MKKRKFLWGLAAFSILLTVGGLVTSCSSLLASTTRGDSSDPDNPNYPEDPGTDDPIEDPIITKSLEVITEPTKTIYKIYDYADYTGLVVEKVVLTDGVETSRDKVDLEDLSLSIAQGEQLSEITDDVPIKITLLDDPQEEYGSAYVHLMVEDLDQVTVTFKNHDGEELYKDTIYVVESITYEGDVPSKVDSDIYMYEFIGWYVEGDEFETIIDLDTYVFEDDTVLIAKFEEKEKPITDGTSIYSYTGDMQGYIVSGYDSTGEKDVVIPNTYDGLPVVGIADEAFMGQSGITSITLGSNITSIGDSAFASMSGSSLTITLNEGLETIGEQAFARNTALTSLEIPGTVSEIPYQCFFNATYLTTLTLNEGVTTIGEQAFYNCGLTDLVLPNTVTTLVESAFSYYYNLTNLTIGTGVDGDQILNSKLFESNSNSYLLATITVDSGSNYLKCEDGYTLLSYDGKILYGVAKKGGDGSEDTYTMPSSVEEVAYRAFYTFRYSNWDTIQIGENVRILGDECFSNSAGRIDVVFNDKLEEIGYRSFGYVWGSGYTGSKELVLPDSVTTIGDQAFYSSTRLSSVTFGANMQNFGVDMFYNANSITSYTISPSNTYLSVDGNVVLDSDQTTIKYYLKNTTSDTSYTMPETVTRVEDGAFYGQTSLTDITFSSKLEYIGEYAFYGNTALANNIVLPSTLTHIGDYAFYNDSRITGIDYPGTVTYLGSYAFYGLTSANFTGSLVVPSGSTMGERVFYNCSRLPSMELNVPLQDYTFYGATSLQSVKVNSADQTSIPTYAFYNCSALTELTIEGGNITTIGASAFYGTSSLENFTIPSNVETIGQNAFYGSGIKEAILPATLTSLGTYAFYNAEKLETVEFKGSLEALPTYVFQGTSSLTTFVWPSDLTTINDRAFRGSGLSTLDVPSGVTTAGDSSTSYVFAEMTNLESVSLPSTLTSLGGYAFYNNSKLTTVNFSEGLTEIPASCFYGCSSLNVSSLPDTVTSLGNNAFRSATAIEEFTLGENVTSLGTYTFHSATKLKTFNRNATSITAIPTYTFYGASSLSTFNLGEGATITEIGSYAFYGTAFTSTPFDMSNVTSIGTYAFRNNEYLEEFNLPTNSEFTSLSQYILAGCTALQEITIPENVTSIGNYAFNGDISLTKLTIENPNATISASSATTAPFAGCSNISEISFNGSVDEAKALIGKTNSSNVNVFFGTTGPSSVRVTCSDGIWTYIAG